MDAIKEAMIAQDDGRSTRAQDELLELVGGQVTVRAEQQAERQPELDHATDDQGFPLNPSCCEVCKQNSITMNAMSVARLFKQITREGTDERLEREERAQDYPPYQNGDA